MSFLKKIWLKGNKNISIQSENDVIINLNINSASDFISFFSNHIGQGDDLSSVLGIIENSETYSNDLETLISQLEFVKKLNENFKYANNINHYNPFDLLGLRKKFYNEYYLNRSYDDALYNQAKTNNIIIIGNSLAGKTRAVFQYIKKITEEAPSTFLIIPQYKNYSSGFLTGVKKIPTPSLAILDELDKYYNHEGANELIKELIGKGIRIIATCKTGPEFESFESLSSVEIKDVFKTIYIKKERLERNNLKDVSDNLNIDLNNTEYDGNIGSLLLPINQMRKRYKKLEDSVEPVDKIAINYLKAIKALNYASNFQATGIYSKSKVDDFCLRLTLGKFAAEESEGKTQIENAIYKAMREIEKEKIKDFLINNEQSLKLLESDEYNLNFVFRVNELIEIEEVYLEKIVQYSPFIAYKDIYKFYNEQEQIKNGFFIKPYHFNNAIKKADEYEKSLSLYQTMIKSGIKPNPKTYALMISKTNNNQDGLKWLEIAKEKEAVSVECFGEYIKKASENDNIIELIKYLLINRNNLYDFSKESISWIFHVLDGKKERINFMEVLNLFLDEQIELTKGPFIYAIKKSSSFEDAKSVYDLAVEKEIPLSEDLLNTLVGKGDSFEDAKSVYDLAVEKGIPLSEELINSLVGKGNSFEDAKSVYDLAVEKEIPLSEEFFNNFVTQGDSFEDAKSVYDLAVEKGIPLSEKFMGSLLWQCRNSENVYTIIKLISELKLKFSNRMVFNIIWKFEELDSAIDFIQNKNVEFVESYPKINLIEDISQKQESLIKDYIHELERSLRGEKKIILNLILSKCFKLNLENEDSWQYTLKYFYIDRNYFYNDIKRKIIETTAPNNVQNGNNP